MSAADPLVKGVHWGYQQGCSFASDKCVDNDVPVNSRFFCTDSTETACSLDRQSVVSCETWFCISMILWETTRYLRKSVEGFLLRSQTMLSGCFISFVSFHGKNMEVPGPFFELLQQFTLSLELLVQQQIGRGARNGLLSSFCCETQQSFLVSFELMYNGQIYFQTNWFDDTLKMCHRCRGFQNRPMSRCLYRQCQHHRALFELRSEWRNAKTRKAGDENRWKESERDERSRKIHWAISLCQGCDQTEN